MKLHEVIEISDTPSSQKFEQHSTTAQAVCLLSYGDIRAYSAVDTKLHTFLLLRFQIQNVFVCFSNIKNKTFKLNVIEQELISYTPGTICHIIYYFTGLLAILALATLLRVRNSSSVHTLLNNCCMKLHEVIEISNTSSTHKVEQHSTTAQAVCLLSYGDIRTYSAVDTKLQTFLLLRSRFKTYLYASVT